MDAKTQRIRELNDNLRQYLTGGMALITPGVAALGPESVDRIIKTVATFDDFCHANDPHQEHDFGAFDADGHRVFFKIDYYDETLTAHSPDPADPSVCRRSDGHRGGPRARPDPCDSHRPWDVPRGPDRSRRAGQGGEHQLLEMLDPVLAREDQLALLVEPRSQPALHRLDEDDVFPLDLVDEVHHRSLLVLRHALGEKELVDRQAMMFVDREDEIRRGIAGAGVGARGAPGNAGRNSGKRTGPWARKIACFSTLCNSRKFPGQE